MSGPVYRDVHLFATPRLDPVLESEYDRYAHLVDPHPGTAAMVPLDRLLIYLGTLSVLPEQAAPLADAIDVWAPTLPRPITVPMMRFNASFHMIYLDSDHVHSTVPDRMSTSAALVGLGSRAAADAGIPGPVVPVLSTGPRLPLVVRAGIRPLRDEARAHEATGRPPEPDPAWQVLVSHAWRRRGEPVTVRLERLVLAWADTDTRGLPPTGLEPIREWALPSPPEPTESEP